MRFISCLWIRILILLHPPALSSCLRTQQTAGGLLCQGLRAFVQARRSLGFSAMFIRNAYPSLCNLDVLNRAPGGGVGRGTDLLHAADADVIGLVLCELCYSGGHCSCRADVDGLFVTEITLTVIFPAALLVREGAAGRLRR